jgi:hypothetical protein
MHVDWELFFLGGGVVFAGVGVLFAGVQTWLTRRQIQRDLDWKRKEAALAYSVTRNDTVRNARLFLDGCFGGVFYEATPLTAQEFESELAKKHTLYTNVSTLLSHYELMFLAMKMGIVDEAVAYEMYGKTVVETVNFFSGFIEFRQRTSNPRAYRYLCERAKGWDEDLRHPTRQSASRLPMLRAVSCKDQQANHRPQADMSVRW